MPSNPRPSDGSTTQDESPTLNVDVSDADSEGLNVEFFESQGWSTVLDWDRENSGDALSDLRNSMNVRTDTGLMYDGTANYLRWAESTNDGRNLYRKSWPANNGRLRVDLHFQWDSFEASGAAFWAVDTAGNRYLIKCNDNGRYDYFNCGTSTANGQWDGIFSVNAPRELQYFYMASDMENNLDNWYDESRLYSMQVQVKEGDSIGTDTSVDGSGDTATYTWNSAPCSQNNWYTEVTEDEGEASKTSSI